MAKVLTTPRAERCIGCGLCSIHSSLIKTGKIDLSNAYVRVTGKPGNYKITIDYGSDTSSKKIVEICPRRCFELQEIEE
jgi:NAD-dependent dihydropyrimidine dehydrogenase PreA subunit